jgi:hypothetical protein
MQTWVAAETEGLDLGDTRLNKRCRSILKDLGDKPAMSIPAACGGWSETLAAYRFFDNSSITPDKILEPHRNSTLKRMSMESVVVVAQDTTVLTLTRPEQQMAGAGPLSDERKYGMFDHPCLALNAQGVPLGILSARLWSREWETFYANKSLTASEKVVAKRAIPFTDKESHRWLEGYMQGCQAAQVCPQTQIIVVSDSEADIIDCFAYANEVRAKEDVSADWITRAFQDRSLTKSHDHSKLWEACENAPVLTTLGVEVRENNPKSGDKTKRNQKRSARNTEVEVRALTVEVKGQSRIEGNLSAQKINVVHTREIHPPAGERPVEWLLLTSLDIGTVDNVVQIIRYYALRWQIEIYFRILKVGCGIEELHFEKIERYQRCLAVYMVVAWRVFYLTMLGRACPEMSCESVLEPEEWKALYTVVNKKPAPSAPPKLEQTLKWIAQLGGHLGRKGDGPPGPQTTWIGLQRLRDFAIAWTIFGPEAQAKPPTCV